MFCESVRVSNELGAGNPGVAMRAIRVCLAMTLLVCGLIDLVLLITRKTLGYTYSNESEVVKYVATMVPLLIVSSLLDGLQAILSCSLINFRSQCFFQFNYSLIFGRNGKKILVNHKLIHVSFFFN